MFKRVIAFLKNLRESRDETKKRRWLIGLSAAAMTIVIILWGMWLPRTIQGIYDAEKQKGAANGGGFFSTMARGTAVLSRELGAFVKARAERIHEIRIEAGGGDYQPDDVPTITPAEIR